MLMDLTGVQTGLDFTLTLAQVSWREKKNNNDNSNSDDRNNGEDNNIK